MRTALPEWASDALAQWPVGQGVVGAMLASALLGPSPKDRQLHVAVAAARGAAQGHAAGQQQSGGGKGVEAPDEVLLGMRKLMAIDKVPRVEVAKQWLRERGADQTANALGNLSSTRNLEAHSVGKRILADDELVAGPVVDGQIKGKLVATVHSVAGCANFSRFGFTLKAGPAPWPESFLCGSETANTDDGEESPYGHDIKLHGGIVLMPDGEGQESGNKSWFPDPKVEEAPAGMGSESGEGTGTEEEKDELVPEETDDGMVGSGSMTLAEDDIVMRRLPPTDSEQELVRLVPTRILKADVEHIRDCMVRQVAIWSYWSSSGRHRTRKQDKKHTAEGGELRRMMLDKWPEVAWEAQLA